MIKEIKYNRLIRNYLLNLELETYDNVIRRYKDGRYTIFNIDNGIMLKNTNIRKMCSILHIEYNTKTYNMILNLIMDIYGAKKL